MLRSARSSLHLVLLVAVVILNACALSGRAAAQAPKTRAPVRYHLEFPALHRQYVHVTMHVDDPSDATTMVAIPAWTPGSYLIRDFARHIYDVNATDRRGVPLIVQRADKQTWRVKHRGQPFTLHYRVYANEASVRTSHIDDTHASLVGPTIFFYVVGELNRPVELELSLPPTWSAHTALNTAPSSHATRARFTAPDYDALVDAPIELGTPQVKTFTEHGATFEYVLSGARNTTIDLDRLVDDTTRIVRAQAEFMGGLPFRRYVFLMRVSPTGGGGLEHANSTSMMMRRTEFATDKGYLRAAKLTAHEFFHLWNVKRIHDRGLGPFDYAHENHSRLLWLHEGFTETIEHYSVLAAGLMEPATFVNELAERWSAYLNKPGRNYSPIDDLSFEAWTKAYQPAPNHPNVVISYYEKGDFIGLALDLELRLRAAAHRKKGSLVGLFRRLMLSHGRYGRGITHHDVVEAASAEAGETMHLFFERYVEGTEEVPLLALLPRIGIEVQRTAPWLDSSGALRTPLTAAQRQKRLWTGLTLTVDAKVLNVMPGTPADRAGLMYDDQLLAIDGLRAQTRETLLARLSSHQPNDTVVLSFFRDGRLQQRMIQLGENPTRTYQFSMVPTAELSPAILRLRNEWLMQADSPPPSSR